MYVQLFQRLKAFNQIIYVQDQPLMPLSKLNLLRSGPILDHSIRCSSVKYITSMISYDQLGTLCAHACRCLFGSTLSLIHLILISSLGERHDVAALPF